MEPCELCDRKALNGQAEILRQLSSQGMHLWYGVYVGSRLPTSSLSRSSARAKQKAIRYCSFRINFLIFQQSSTNHDHASYRTGLW